MPPDRLTGLSGRDSFLGCVRGALAAAGGSQHTLLLLSLDRFRQVNNTLGLPTGDAILRRAARRLALAAGPDAILGRVNGDKFAILLPASADAPAIGQHLLELFAHPFAVDGQAATLGASIGAASSPEGGNTAEALMAAAGIAVERVKRAGGHAFLTFEPGMRDAARSRLALEAELRAALALERTRLRAAVADGQFSVHYQPKVIAADHRLIGFEALARWCHPDHGPIGPDIFIPLAEEIGVIGLLGQRVLRMACAAAAGWPLPAQGGPLSVSVNISPRQLAEGADLIAGIAGILAETGLDPARLTLEITESALLGDVGAVLGGLKGLGVQLSLDDFGSGYAALGNLIRFPFDELKLDRSFVRGLHAGSGGERMIRGIAALGASLGLVTVAEGVETEAEAAAIRAAGVTLIQGYLIGRPKPAEAIAATIARLDRTMAECESPA
jgi:diguanylate cyclase (GGDEF)-like protein